MITNIYQLKKFFNFLYYGTIINKKKYVIFNNEKFNPSHCNLLKKQDIQKYYIGTCEDTVLLTKFYFDKWKIQYKIFFVSISENYDGINGIKNDKTHIFIIYKDKKNWKWLEGSAIDKKNNMLQNKNPYILAYKILRFKRYNETSSCYLRQIFNYPNQKTSYIDFYKTIFKEKIIYILN